MSGFTLGLDLGPQSIGWAVLDESSRQMIATGVRVFPEGVDRDQKGGELSKNEVRRVARGMRRQIARRARRKRALCRILIESGLLSNNPCDQMKLDLLDPYDLRRRALTKKLHPHEFGRLLVHLNQRRGFCSNRKADRSSKKETAGILAEISELANTIQSGGYRTLGQYLSHLGADPHCRIRGRHTRRDMYEHEFEAVWSAQSEWHSNILTTELHDRIDRVMFYQRPMYWPKSVIGRCELEPSQPRCPRGHRLAQRFRLLQEVNSLRLVDSTADEERSLTPEERDRLIKILSAAKERSFEQIRKSLGLLETCQFNLERGDRKKLLGMPTDAILAHKNLFGKKWYGRSEDEKNAIVDDLLLLERNKIDESTIRQRAVECWGLSADSAERLLDVDLPDGYMNYSLQAIHKLLPFMETGLLLMADDQTPCALVKAGYQRPDQRPVRIVDRLPAPPELTNPIVRQALHEVRKLVNALIREYGKPTRIHIELAREVKGSSRLRQEWAKKMRQREAQRNVAAEKINEAGAKATRDAVDRYLLWQEQNEICIYSGKTISIKQLLGGEIDVEHILPYSRSLDNSMANKVVCFRNANADKSDRTPYEWLAESDPKRFEAVCLRASKLPYNKRRKFIQKEVVLDEFVARQLVDTAYISKAVAQYLCCLGADVLCSKGQLTAELRWQWGLGSVLRDDGLNLKNRDDHRHHAVDAIVIALTDRARLQQLAKIRRRGGTRLTGEILPDPWPNFRKDVETAVNAINVSHRVRRKVAGALHEETIYGPTEQPGQFVYRKPIEALTLSMVDDIRDDSIKQLVTDRLKAFGIAPGKGNKIPAEVWKEPLLMPSGVPVKKVRLIKRDQTIQPIRGNTAYVKPGSNHHVCLFEFIDEQGKTKCDAIFVSTLEAAKRVIRKETLIQRVHPNRPEARFLMSLSKNEMVLLTHNGKEDLYRFEKASSTSGQMWFRYHTAAGKSNNKTGLVSKMPNTLIARKVTVDPLGNIRWAND